MVGSLYSCSREIIKNDSCVLSIGIKKMVLESLLRGQFALKHPLALLFFAIVISTASMGVALITFPEYASVLAIAFITIGSMPVFFKLFAHEEREEASKPRNPATFLERHFHIVKAFAFFFIGIVIAYSFWYLNLPAEYQNNVFREQEKNWQRITALGGQATAMGVMGNCQNAIQQKDILSLALGCIFSNNAIVLAWSLLLSFFYGAGAIFLIGWNASVIGLVIGKEIALNGFESGILRAIGLLPHGMPEIVAYFIGAIAGGIVSATIAKKSYLKKEFETIALDVLVMIVTAYLVLLAAAFIEAYLLVTP